MQDAYTYELHYTPAKMIIYMAPHCVEYDDDAPLLPFCIDPRAGKKGKKEQKND